MRYASIFIISIMLLLNACKKDGAGHPHLIGTWRSETDDIELTFRDGRFAVRKDAPLISSGYSVHTGSYSLDGSTVYLTATQVETFEPAYMTVPETFIFQNTQTEHFKFKIIGQSVQLLKADKVAGMLLISDGFYTKKY